jgi:hypothetical protein
MVLNILAEIGIRCNGYPTETQTKWETNLTPMSGGFPHVWGLPPAPLPILRIRRGEKPKRGWKY